MRKIGELNDVIARLKRWRSSGGSQLVHDGQFRKAIQTLEVIAKGGMVGRRDLYRAVAVIARVLDEDLKRMRRDEAR